jgi:hypothetical protein
MLIRPDAIKLPKEDTPLPVMVSSTYELTEIVGQAIRFWREDFEVWVEIDWESKYQLHFFDLRRQNAFLDEYWDVTAFCNKLKQDVGRKGHFIVHEAHLVAVSVIPHHGIPKSMVKDLVQDAQTQEAKD